MSGDSVAAYNKGHLIVHVLSESVKLKVWQHVHSRSTQSNRWDLTANIQASSPKTTQARSERNEPDSRKQQTNAKKAM
jgi:hypothetical protein